MRTKYTTLRFYYNNNNDDDGDNDNGNDNYNDDKYNNNNLDVDTDRLYVSKKEEVRGLIQVEGEHKAKIINITTYNELHGTYSFLRS